MRVLVTGSAGHLGEGLVRTLRERNQETVGLDLLDSPFTTHVGSVADPDLVRRCLKGVDPTALSLTPDFGSDLGVGKPECGQDADSRRDPDVQGWRGPINEANRQRDFGRGSNSLRTGPPKESNR